MGTVKEINIKNRKYYLFNDMINIDVFDSNVLKIDKRSYKDIDIYHTGYITINRTGDGENFHSVNPLYLIIGEVDGNIEKNGSKYFVFDSTYENREVLQKYTELWDRIKNGIKTLNGGKEVEYGEDFIKIKFDKNDELPLKKLTKFPTLAIIIRCVFEEDGKFYPQRYLDECLYQL